MFTRKTGDIKKKRARATIKLTEHSHYARRRELSVDNRIPNGRERRKNGGQRAGNYYEQQHR